MADHIADVVSVGTEGVHVSEPRLEQVALKMRACYGACYSAFR